MCILYCTFNCSTPIIYVMKENDLKFVYNYRNLNVLTSFPVKYFSVFFSFCLCCSPLYILSHSQSAVPGMITGVLTMAHTVITPTRVVWAYLCPNHLRPPQWRSLDHKTSRCLCLKVWTGRKCMKENKWYNIECKCWSLLIFVPALDARLEVGLEQQAELMLKMMATLEADAILQALTSTSPSGTHTQNKH